MNRMDCFKNQKSEYHWGATSRMPVCSHYPITHEKVMAALDKEWRTANEIMRRIPRVVRPCAPTVLRHLRDAKRVEMVKSRIENGTTEWRRV